MINSQLLPESARHTSAAAAVAVVADAAAAAAAAAEVASAAPAALEAVLAAGPCPATAVDPETTHVSALRWH